MNKNFPFFKYKVWACAVREDAPTKEREGVLAIVKNIQTGLRLTVTYTTNNVTSFPAWGIDEWDDKMTTLLKELEEETGITKLENIQELEDLYFEILNYSPHRKRNNYRKTHVFYAETTQENFDIHEDEKAIQIPGRNTLDELQASLDKVKDITDISATQYLVDSIKSKGLV